MATIAGLDEAGRGPIIGPMVMCAAMIDEGAEERLKKIGVKDSKLLTPGQREALFEKIIDIVKKYELVIISPKEIDNAVNSEELNLNWLEANKSAELIDKLKPDKVYVDCPSNNVSAYSRYLKERLKSKKIEIIAEHHADAKYVIVGAASIIAKVTRDNEIKKIQKKVKDNIGSGYPSDPVTVEFVKKNFSKYPGIFRKSWETYRRVAESKKQSKLADF